MLRASTLWLGACLERALPPHSTGLNKQIGGEGCVVPLDKVYVLMREDTHGTPFVIGQYLTLEAARHQLDVLRFHEHHQHYYIETR